MGKFINGSGGNSSSGGLGSGLITLIVVSVVGIISIILLVVLFAGNNQPTVTCNPPVLKQSVEIELDAKAPGKLAYFDQIDENCYPESKIKVDDSQLKTNQLGQYTVKISIDKDKKDVTVVVSDHTPPVLKLKKQVVLRINSNLVDNNGISYNVDDFVDSCEDNSKAPCTYKFTDDKYLSLHELGVYPLKIEAYDTSNNVSEEKTSYLFILTEDAEAPADDYCVFGSTKYDSANSYVGYDLTEYDCAVSKSDFRSARVVAKVDKKTASETKKLRSQLSLIPNVGANFVTKKCYSAIYNEENTGLVGFSVRLTTIAVTSETDNTGEYDREKYENQCDAAANSDDSTLIVDYYLLADSSRHYLSDPYNIDSFKEDNNKKDNK